MPYTPEQQKSRRLANPEKFRAYSLAWRERNRDKALVNQRIWRANNPERLAAYKAKYDPAVAAARHLKTKYGLTKEQWDAIFEAQGRVCSLCGTGTPGGRYSWHTDHCHTTGKVRGILCWLCNSGLGKFKDSPVLLRKCADYLESHA